MELHSYIRTDHEGNRGVLKIVNLVINRFCGCEGSNFQSFPWLPLGSKSHNQAFALILSLSNLIFLVALSFHSKNQESVKTETLIFSSKSSDSTDICMIEIGAEFISIQITAKLICCLPSKFNETLESPGQSSQQKLNQPRNF